MRDIALLFFIGRLQQFVRLAQRARHGGKSPRAFAELLLRADQPGHMFDRVDLIADRFLEPVRQHEPLLGRCGRRLRLGQRTRLIGGFGRRCDQGRRAVPAQGPHEMSGRDLGTPAAPALAAGYSIEVRCRYAHHQGDVVDRRQPLLVKPLCLGQHFRRYPGRDHVVLP